MIQVSCFNKLGDLVYALPVLRALARIRGEKIHLLLSGSCWQFVPLLWEQPYFGEIDLDESQAHATVPIDRGAIFPEWEWFKPGEGLNLSLQPSFFTDDAPVSWTHCYMKAAGVTELTHADCVALPSLVNHRRWLEGIDVSVNGRMQTKPETIILAPETDTLDELMPHLWQAIIDQVVDADYTALIVGTRRLAILERCTDLRCQTSVPVLARLIAESSGFIGAHSFPWHLARQSETPAVCLQTWREGLRRCLPVDTACVWVEPKDYGQAVETVLYGETVKAPV